MSRLILVKFQLHYITWLLDQNGIFYLQEQQTSSEDNKYVKIQRKPSVLLHSNNSERPRSCDFKTTTKVDTIENPVDSGKTFFDISVNTGQICMGFEADTPEK